MRLGNVYAWLFGWPMLARLHKGLFYLSGRALGLLNYQSPRLSGERLAIALGTRGKERPVVFDVGANEGGWVAEVLALRPDACIHAFEPQAHLATGIAATQSKVVVNHMALGDAPGALELADYEGHAGSQHASLLRGVIDGLHHGVARYTRVPVGTLDSYCDERDIDHIDLLKIDVEGFEIKVLQGARRMISERRLGTIQFEFNEMNIVGGAFLDQFFTALAASHDLYRLLPHGLVQLHRGSHWFNEQFVFQNIIALRRP
jgi:FkbM family methyltransferase